MTAREGQRAVTSPESSQRVAVLRSTRSPDSVQVRGHVNGQPWSFIVDSGSNHTLLRPDVLGGRALPEVPQGLCDVTGRRTTLRGPVAVELVIEGFRTVLPVYVADELEEPCILGLDFLQMNDCMLDFASMQMKVGGVLVPLLSSPTKTTHAGTRALRVRVAETVRLKPGSETFLKCKTDGPGFQSPGVVEAGLIRRSGVLVGRTIVDTQNATVPVMVANLSSSPVRLQAGTYVGTCEPVDLVEPATHANASNDEEGVLPAHLSDLMDRSSVGLTLEQRSEARALLHDFADVFSSGDNDVGRTTLTEHTISTGDSRPIKVPPRRLPIGKRQEAEKIISDMSEQGLIEESHSPWSSPLVLVRKKDGTLRCCVDYRLLNNVTMKDSYPLPRIDETLDALSGSQWFSTLDLKSGYHQIALADKDRPKTAFSSGSGLSLWQWRVMPFGLCNAPATFERLMEVVLSGLHWKALLVYLDDIIVFGTSFQEELQRLREVFVRMRNAGLKLSPKKCHLFRREVQFLGHVVSHKGVHTDPAKTEAIDSWPVPRNKKELRSFLGLCTYYRKFVKDFATIAAPLHWLTKDDVEYAWDEKCASAFKLLKNVLTRSPVLAYPDPGAAFILDTDASSCGIGAVLSQTKEGVEHVVAYYSRSLSSSERNYCTTRRELLAVVDAIRHFHHFLYGADFCIRTDHAALKWLRSLKDPEGQLARWMTRLEQYTFTVQHRPGAKHTNADCLSRRPCQTDCNHCNKKEASSSSHCRAAGSATGQNGGALRDDADHTTDCPDSLTMDLRTAQRNDHDLAPLIPWVESGKRPAWEEVAGTSPTTKRYWAQWDLIHLRDGVLMRAWESSGGHGKKWLTIVPQGQKKDIMAQSHGAVASGHFGIKKTLLRLREKFYWIGMRRDVIEWCRTCTACAAKKGPHRTAHAPLQIMNAGSPMERVAIDIAGPLPVSTSGNRYILVAMDYFAKWPEAYAIPNQEATTVAQVLVNEFFSRFGVPYELHSDQGRNFESNVFKECCKILGIRKTRTTPMHPESDGMVERFNRTLGQELAKQCKNQQDDWDKHLPLLLMAYRSAEHESTGYTPAQLMIGREMRLPIDLMLSPPPHADMTSPTVTDFARELRYQLSLSHAYARENLKISSEAMKLRSDARASTELLEHDDQVWLYNPKRKKGLSPKLMSPWEGPYTVVKRLSDVTYRIQRTGGGPMRVVHYNRLWKHKGAPHFSWENDLSTTPTVEPDMSVRQNMRDETIPDTSAGDVRGEKVFPRRYDLRKNRRPPARFVT